MKLNSKALRALMRLPAANSNEAILSSAEGFTAFSFGGYNIRFRAPYSLERYVNVVRWDDGYLVVLAKYRHNAEPEEEYIDLKPILDELYIDSAAFLKPIKSVRIAYDWYKEYCDSVLQDRSILNDREIAKIS